MNAMDILRYGQETVQQAIEGLNGNEWQSPGACGSWSIKDIVAHLASFELLLIDVLDSILGAETGPVLARFTGPGAATFNDDEVADRAPLTVAALLAEFSTSHARTLALLEQVPVATRSRNGTLPWYGAGYSLDDFIVYAYYGHKREHGAQIALFRDQLKRSLVA